MSDTDREVLALLDRAVASSPPLHLDREDVVARGEQLLRRRRASRAGMAFGGLALAGAVWLGAGVVVQDLPGPAQTSPASVSWEVDRPVSLQLLDDEELEDGRTWSVTLSKDATSSTATFVVDGQEQVVQAQPSRTGIETFATDHGTLVVWAGADVVVTFVPELPVTMAGAVSGEDGAVQWALLEAGLEPDDVVLSDGERAWTAGGRAGETREVADGGVSLTVVSFPGVDLAGYLDAGAFYEVGTLTVLSHELPWWRGGDHVVATVARLPREAVFAREVLREDAGGEPRGISAPRPTSLVGSSSMVLFASDWAGDGTGSKDMVYGVQWSTDGKTWQDQGQEREPGAVSPPPPGTVGPGGTVTLLGEPYRVATDAHGWPRLVTEDGSDFLVVSDDMGPSEGGVVMWREHWWPWSERNEVHFLVGGQPVVSPPADVQDEVTIWGPAGVVGVAAATSSS